MKLDKLLTLEHMQEMPIDQIVELYRQGYRLEGVDGPIKKLSSCTGAIVQGTVKTITMTPSGGTPPYKLDFLVDGSNAGSWTGITGAQTFSHTFSEPFGNHTYSVNITDGCIVPQVNTDQCTITIMGTISISGCTSPIVTGGTCQLNLDSCVPSPCPSITWTSNNTAVATVNPSTGTVTGVSAGTAQITALATGYTPSNAITVTVVSCPLPSVVLTIPT